MITGSKELIRDINTKLVIQTVMDEGPISRADISKKLGLTKATISAIVQDLIDRHFLKEIGTAKVSSGRKPVLLEFCFNCAYGITVDISGNKLTVLSATLGGEHCEVKQYSSENNRDMIITELIQAIRAQKDLIPECPYGLIGIALGIHGIVDHGQITFTPYSDYANLDLVSILEKEFQVPVYVVNEANLSVLGDYTFHYPGKNVVELSIHTGIGLGIIVKQKLFSGTHGFAGEFGHTIIQVDGRPCPCGNRGCLEQYASERVLLAQLADKKKLSSVSADDFARLYQKKDADAIEIMNLFIKYIAIAINNILNTVDPDIIIINSSFTMNFPQIIPDIKAAISGRNHDICSLLPSELQDMSILLGGICYARNQFLE